MATPGSSLPAFPSVSKPIDGMIAVTHAGKTAVDTGGGTGNVLWYLTEKQSMILS